MQLVGGTAVNNSVLRDTSGKPLGTPITHTSIPFQLSAQSAGQIMNLSAQTAQSSDLLSQAGEIKKTINILDRIGQLFATGGRLHEQFDPPDLSSFVALVPGVLWQGWVFSRGSVRVSPKAAKASSRAARASWAPTASSGATGAADDGSL